MGGTVDSSCLQRLLGSHPTFQAGPGPIARIMPHLSPTPACSLVNAHVTQLLQVVPFAPIDHHSLRHKVVICGINCDQQFSRGSE